MDVKDYATIGGILFNIYRYFFPKNQTKYDLSFVKEKEIDLHTESFNSITKLKFLYDEKAFNHIKLFEFSIRNTGNVDITSDMLREEIIISFPNNCIILEAGLKDKSNDLKLQLAKKLNNLSIIWNLLKPNERPIIYTLLHLNSNSEIKENYKKSFLERINIKHRIIGIKNIGKFYSLEVSTHEKSKLDSIIEGYINLFVACLLLLQAPIIIHWLLGFFSDYSKRPFEWETGDVIFTVMIIMLSLFHFLGAFFDFNKARNFK